jgi:uncharacterized repeat protein (TIGR03803 family)
MPGGEVNLMKSRSWKMAYMICAMLVGIAIAAHGQVFKTLVNFNGTNGQYPTQNESLVQWIDGNLYGTTSLGGLNFIDGGVAYRFTPANNELTTVYSFCENPPYCADGRYPFALVQGIDGNFYGTTEFGGSSTACGINGCGTVFKLTAGGKLEQLYSFGGGADGTYPLAGLVQARNGILYGTTSQGGNSPYCSSSFGCGTIFKISPTGSLTTVYNFCSQIACADGELPLAPLVQGSDGNLYGTTYEGGDLTCFPPTGCGTVFKITPEGTLTTLHSFAGYPTDGASPAAGLIQGNGGSFYGSTPIGGVNDACPSSAGYGCGTVFKITATGTLTTLYSFCTQSSCADGVGPNGVIQGSDGRLYGTTGAGGSGGGCTYGCGTAFSLASDGVLTTLYSFSSADGYGSSGLVQATNGIFYGTMSQGGTSFDGTLFSISTGLAPFVAFVQPTGKIGGIAEILGYGLTGTTGISFNKTPASFTVVSNTFIKAIVPTGATTGYVIVTTPTRTLTSNVPFRVIP